MPRLWLICLCSHVIKSCKSFSQPTFNSKSPYYFQKVVWSLSFDYFLPGSTLYVPCVTSSFIHLFFLSPPLSGFEYGNAVWANTEVTFRSAEEPFHQLFTTGHPVMASLAFDLAFFFFPPLLKYPSRCWWYVWLRCNYSNVELYMVVSNRLHE